MYTVKVNFPNMMKGEAIRIDGLGELENGKTYDITKEQAEAFRVAHSRPVEVGDDGDGVRTEMQIGPTLLEAFKGHPGIIVETSKTETKQDDKEKGGDK